MAMRFRSVSQMDPSFLVEILDDLHPGYYPEDDLYVIRDVLYPKFIVLASRWMDEAHTSWAKLCDAFERDGYELLWGYIEEMIKIFRFVLKLLDFVELGNVKRVAQVRQFHNFLHEVNNALGSFTALDPDFFRSYKPEDQDRFRESAAHSVIMVNDYWKLINSLLDNGELGNEEVSLNDELEASLSGLASVTLDDLMYTPSTESLISVSLPPETIKTAVHNIVRGASRIDPNVKCKVILHSGQRAFDGEPSCRIYVVSSLQDHQVDLSPAKFANLMGPRPKKHRGLHNSNAIITAAQDPSRALLRCVEFYRDGTEKPIPEDRRYLFDMAGIDSPILFEIILDGTLVPNESEPVVEG